MQLPFKAFFEAEGKSPRYLAGLTIVLATIILAACITVPAAAIGQFFKILMVVVLGVLAWDLNNEWLITHLKGDNPNGESSEPTEATGAGVLRSVGETIQD